jgi:hypothetical protein
LEEVPMSEKIAPKPEERMRELFLEFARGLSYNEKDEKTFDTLDVLRALNDARSAQGPLRGCRDAVLELFGTGKIEERNVENFIDLYWRRQERFIKAGGLTRDGRQIWIVVETKS